MWKPRFICVAGAVFLLYTVIRSANSSDKLPLCPPSHPELSDNEDYSNVLLVSTLDGQMTALDMGNSGAHMWSVATGPGPMLSSTISQVELTNNAQFVKLIPSLAGGIYKFDGHSVEPVPMTAEALLKSSFKFADNTVISGGKESRTYGIELNSGRIIYECTVKGCSRDDEESRNEMNDVIVLQRETQTVRAIEPRTGGEKWNFSVSQHHVQYHPSIDEICGANVTDDEDVADEGHGDEDFAVVDDGKEIKAVVSDGIICQTDKESIVWRHAFPSPIVNVWRLYNGRLTKVNLFSTSHIPRREGAESEPGIMPLLFIGSYKNQLYIQESEHQRKKSSKNIRDHQILPYSEYPRITWKPYLITASSRTPVINHGLGPPPDLPLLSHDKKTAENTALAVIAEAGSDYPFDSGLYLFPDESNLEYDFVDDYNNVSEGVDSSSTENSYAEFYNPMESLTLWNWWKEVLIISIVTAAMMNFLITQPALNRIRDNFRNTLERINRRPPDILFVERRVEVPYEVKVEVPVPHMTREASCASSNATTLGSGSGHTQEFVSRFLTDYEPVRCLGHGGFGVVFESKNKIDDAHYAVKRVQLPLKEEAKKKVMREVKFLAKLDHKNIVRYYNTWLETPPPEWQKNWDSWWKKSEYGDEISPMNYSEASSMIPSPPCQSGGPLKALSFSNNNDSFEIYFERSDKKSRPDVDDEISDSVVFQNSNRFENYSEKSTSGGIVFEHSDTSNSDRSTKPKSKKVSESLTDVSSSQDVCEAIAWDEAHRPRSYLYIVMQLCQKESLSHWLKFNCDLVAEMRHEKVKAVFHELCLGVDYVHTQGLIHRDLKPSNIFFSCDGTVKIGDFGLVTGVEGSSECAPASEKTDPEPLYHGDSSSQYQSPIEYQKFQHTDQVGTELYMSPEQLIQRSYNHKVDIYALGVILFELLVPFQTQMERVDNLKRIRNLNFPPEFLEMPGADLVKCMVSHDPAMRPDASEILKTEFFATEFSRRESELVN